jgi:uncharacterized membrane protein
MTDDIRTYKPLLFVVGLGLILRLFMLTAYGIWHDERVSVLISHGLHHSQPVLGEITPAGLHASNNLASVVDATILDNGNGLLYNIILHYWIQLLGDSDFAIRFLSVFLSVLCIPFIHAFAEKLFASRRIAIAAAFMFAIHPLLIAYAQQARPYALATFFTILSSTIFLNIIRDRATFSTYVWYAMWSSCALLTHYLTSYVLLSHAVIFVLEVSSSRTWINYFLFGCLVVLVFATWMINGGLEGMKVLDQQNARYALQASNYVEGQKSFAMPATMKNIVTGWVQVWLQVFGNQYQSFGFRIREIGVMVFIPLVLIIAFARRVRKLMVQRKKMAMLLVLVFFQTVFATVLALRAGHCISFQTLYASFAVPYACVLLAWILVELFQEERFANLSIALSILIYGIMLSSCFTTYLNTNAIFPDSNGHARKADELLDMPAGSRVAIKSSMDLQLIGIYMPERSDVFLYVDQNVVDDSYSVERVP